MERSRFTDILIRQNVLDRRGFKEWVFCPGMLYGSNLKWWGDRAKRNSDHEGLDLLLYRNKDGNIHRLDETTEVPAIYDGTIVKIIDDFLGRSIFIEHGGGFFTAFGHTRPLDGIVAGTRVKEGEIIATIAEISGPHIKIAPHLHITAGWVSEGFDYEKLKWETIGSSEMIELIDPLDIIGGNAAHLEAGSPECGVL